MAVVDIRRILADGEYPRSNETRRAQFYEDLQDYKLVELGRRVAVIDQNDPGYWARRQAD